MKDHYKFTFKALGVAIAGPGSDKIDMEKGISFTCEGLSFKVFNATTGAVINDPYVLMNMKPQGSGAPLFDEAAPIGSVAGSGENPHIVNTPWIFNGNTSPVVEFENKTGVVVDIYVTMHGYRDDGK